MYILFPTVRQFQRNLNNYVYKQYMRSENPCNFNWIFFYFCIEPLIFTHKTCGHDNETWLKKKKTRDKILPEEKQKRNEFWKTYRKKCTFKILFLWKFK